MAPNALVVFFPCRQRNGVLPHESAVAAEDLAIGMAIGQLLAKLRGVADAWEEGKETCCDVWESCCAAGANALGGLVVLVHADLRNGGWCTCPAQCNGHRNRARRNARAPWRFNAAARHTI